DVDQALSLRFGVGLLNHAARRHEARRIERRRAPCEQETCNEGRCSGHGSLGLTIATPVDSMQLSSPRTLRYSRVSTSTAAPTRRRCVPSLVHENSMTAPRAHHKASARRLAIALSTLAVAAGCRSSINPPRAPVAPDA